MNHVENTPEEREFASFLATLDDKKETFLKGYLSPDWKMDEHKGTGLTGKPLHYWEWTFGVELSDEPRQRVDALVTKSMLLEDATEPIHAIVYTWALCKEDGTATQWGISFDADHANAACLIAQGCAEDVAEWLKNRKTVEVAR